MLDHALEDLKCDYNCNPSGRSGSGVNLSNAFAVKAVSAWLWEVSALDFDVQKAVSSQTSGWKLWPKESSWLRLTLTPLAALAHTVQNELCAPWPKVKHLQSMKLGWRRKSEAPNAMMTSHAAKSYLWQWVESKRAMSRFTDSWLCKKPQRLCKGSLQQEAFSATRTSRTCKHLQAAGRDPGAGWIKHMLTSFFWLLDLVHHELSQQISAEDWEFTMPWAAS